MPFHFGQVLECFEDGRRRQAIVLQTREDGQEALLRHVDTRVEEWVRGPDLIEAGQWRWAQSEH